MAVGDKQKIIVSLISQLLDAEPINTKFEWFINKHQREHFKDKYPIIDNIFKQIQGDPNALMLKQERSLQVDAFFGEPYFIMIEFDELQHFSSSRLISLRLYPDSLSLGFDKEQYMDLCCQHSINADNYRRSKTTKEFNFIGGRTAQRAYLDTFRDLLPALYGLKSAIRISEFDIDGITENNNRNRRTIENLLKRYL